ncbi:MAG: [glutamine synthetase] adenylyltransferase / [glutamine synthetase]-adenylyl-L-tyrosine, partial [Variibacter sp.]|nr:[glutamine synthetase] adenylyltransferase / [glutamine synthetase]-adenylyl-L-tyrosine [Variibacter sp.]
QKYRGLRGEAARASIEALAPALVLRFARGEDPDAAMLAFDRFLAGLHGGGRLLSMLRQNADVLDLLGLILGTAPRLTEILGQHPEAMDAILDPAFFGALPDDAALAVKLDTTIGQSASYEDLLDRVRLFRQEQLFLIGARILTGTVSARQAGEAFARLADVLIRRVHAAVEEHFAKTHGRIRGQQVAILAMGKLGGREMTASSDLDLIILYDFDSAHPQSDGPRALTGAQYFARLTQRIIAALTIQTNYGGLYAVDMRLRPSGRSGPVATHIESFAQYQHNEAWTWEHMALTRARVVSAPPEFCARAERVIHDILQQPRDAEFIAGDAREMRAAIAAERTEANTWDLKYAAGGLIDVEFIAQYLQLVHAADHPEILSNSTAEVLERAWTAGLLPPDDAEVLRRGVQLLHDLTQVLRLCLPGPFDAKSASPQLLRLLARAADLPDFAAVDADLGETEQRVRASFERVLTPRSDLV